MSTYRALVAKDLRVELRTWQSVPAMALLAVGTFVLFRFGLDRTELEGTLAAGILLVTTLFAGLLAVNRLFVPEREEGGFETMRLAPVPAAAVFLAKTTVLFVYLAIFGAITLAAFAFFFTPDIASLPLLLLVILLFNAAISVTGAFVSPIATNSRSRDLLVPILLIPLLVPAIVAAAQVAGPVFNPSLPAFSSYSGWLIAAVLYDFVFAALGLALYDFLLDD